MKSVVTSKGVDRSYPCLMKLKVSWLIVLFNNEKCGVVVSPDENTQTGDYSEHWKINVFEPFHGSITLSND